MTKLTKPVHRVSNKSVRGRALVLTIAPSGAGDLIGIRQVRSKIQYVVKLDDLYRVAALWYGQKEAAAKREARRNGVSWRVARKAFVRANSIN